MYDFSSSTIDMFAWIPHWNFVSKAFEADNKPHYFSECTEVYGQEMI